MLSLIALFGWSNAPLLRRCDLLLRSHGGLRAPLWTESGRGSQRWLSFQRTSSGRYSALSGARSARRFALHAPARAMGTWAVGAQIKPSVQTQGLSSMRSLKMGYTGCTPEAIAYIDRSKCDYYTHLSSRGQESSMPAVRLRTRRVCRRRDSGMVKRWMASALLAALIDRKPTAVIAQDAPIAR